MRKFFMFCLTPILWICDIIDLIIQKIDEWDTRFTIYMDKKIDDLFEKRNNRKK